jgi:glycosyltransferase involved in cell wall biosynthesis
MICYSAIIPQRDRADEVRRQLPALTAALASLGQPYEIVVVDDGSSPASLRLLNKLLNECHALRLIRLDEPGGASVALSAGIQAARGEVLIAAEAGDNYPAAQIPWLMSWLERADLVVGRRRRFGWAKFWHRLARIPRGMLLGLESHDPECLLWIARREALGDIQLAPGMARYLAAFVARRGYRVCETYVQHGAAMHRLDDVRPNPGDLLAAWWHCRRWRPQNAYELSAGEAVTSRLRVVNGEDIGPSQADGSAVGSRRQVVGLARVESGVIATTTSPQAKTA